MQSLDGVRGPGRLPLARGRPGEGEQSLPGLLEAVGHSPALQPPLAQDGAAVRAALTTSWSSGQTEGHVGKLKMLKRQTFGLGSFDLLRRRVLLTA